MDMLITPWVIAIAFGLIYGALPLLIHALYHRRTRVVTCPRTGGLAGIITGNGRPLSGGSVGRISHCSLWPEVGRCRGECMRQ